MAFWRSLGTTLEMIKWEHSVFALPFALTGAVLAAGGWPHAMQLFWIIVCMVTARSAAMAFNRWADADLDAANPRTASRAIPAGLALARLCRCIHGSDGAPVCLQRVAAEPSFTAAVARGARGAAGLLVHEADHALVAPGAGAGAGHGAGGRLDCYSREPGRAHPGADRRGALLGGGLRCACMPARTLQHDRAVGLRSIPQALGLHKAFGMARVMHGVMLLLLVWLLHLFHLGRDCGVGAGGGDGAPVLRALDRVAHRHAAAQCGVLHAERNYFGAVLLFRRSGGDIASLKAAKKDACAVRRRLVIGETRYSV